MASLTANESAAVKSDTYERNPVNKSELGKDFEVNVAIYSVLTLLHNDRHAIAVEYKAAPARFDDIVLRVQNGADHEYYYRQVKHKDTSKDQEAVLTWNDLLRTKKKPSDTNPPFGLPWYYEISLLSSANQQDMFHALNGVKELGIVTNYCIAKHGLEETSNLEELACKLLYPSSRESKHCITEGDLKTFFVEWSDPSSWRPPTNDQKSYKFTPEAIKAIEKGTEAGVKAANKSLDLNSYGAFLGKLVFHVSMPNVGKLKAINQNLLKVFLPFHKAFLSDRYITIAEEFMKLFATTAPAKAAEWATFECRRRVFDELANSWHSTIDWAIPFGLANDTTSKPPWAYLATENFDLNVKWKDRNPMKLVNISNPNSSPTTTTLKVLTALQNTSSLKRKLETKRVKDKDSIENVIKYFEDLDKELDEEVSDIGELIREIFYCVIAISPTTECFEMARSGLVVRLSSLTNLRKWIRFVLVTQSPIIIDSKQDLNLEGIEGTLLDWRDLAEEFKTFLFERTLHIDNGMTTSLKALGFERSTIGDWLQPKPLAELIDHDRERPLSLGMPQKDANLGADYVDRLIKLPLVRNNEKSTQRGNRLFTCNETEFDAQSANLPVSSKPSGQHNLRYPQPTTVYQHLLRPVKSQKYGKSACLWVRSKDNRSHLTDQSREHVVPAKESDYTIHETKLLADGVPFGTGSLKGDKLLVIIDYPGKGKSWLLTSLSNRFLDNWSKHPNHLLIRVNLREIKDWEKHSKSGLDFILANSKVPIKEDSPVIDSSTSLALAILHRKYHRGPASIFVLLDGYDEINERQRRMTRFTTDALIKANGIKRVILTSRPESTLESELEKHFKQFSLHLKNFERDDQINYMTRRWTSKLANSQSLSEKQVKRIGTYAKGLVDFASKALKDENKTFLDIPLQCWIFSECFFRQLEEYLKTCSSELPDAETRAPQFHEKKFNILSLYDRFYEAKIDVLLNEKANIPPEGNEALAYLRSVLSECFLGSTMRLSMIHMMQNNTEDAAVLANFNWNTYWGKVQKYRHDEEASSEYDEDLKRAKKLGIVQDDECASYMKPQDIRFLHRTFAEYFFARGLLRSFVLGKPESLLYGGTAPADELEDKRFKIVTEKVLVAEELAGVRRFFDGMLANHLPASTDSCPFSSNTEWTAVLTRWPVIGHEKFNEHLVEAIVAHSHQKPRNEQSISAEQFFEMLRNEALQRPGLESIKMSHLEEFPHIASMLIHCIKEYACRPGTCDAIRINTLSSSFTHSLLACLLTQAKGRKCDETKSEIVISSLLGWFDRAPSVPAHVSDTLTRWFFALISALIREKSSDYPAIGSVIESACQRLSHHSNDKDFDEKIYAIASSMLSNNKTESVEAFQFFRVNLLNTVDLFDEKNRLSDDLFQGILVSLGKRALSPQLLERLARVFLKTLTTHVEQLAKCSAATSSIEAYGKFLSENIVHPKAFMKTVEFFVIGNESKLPGITVAELLAVALDYVTQIQPRLFDMSHRVDRIFATLVDKDNLNALTYKMTSTLHMFYYLLASDMVISRIRDAGKRKEAMLNVFITELGHKSLTAYAYAKCCCDCNQLWYTGFGVHFPREMPANGETSERQNEIRFEHFFADLLRFLWTEKGEVGFIDFLLLKGVDRITESRSLTKAELVLRAIHLAKLPCLLSSDLVVEYIPQKLSQTGLEHLANTLKSLPLFSCLDICYKSQPKRLPDVTDENTSLWDAFVQTGDSQCTLFQCKRAQDRTKILLDKLCSIT